MIRKLLFSAFTASLPLIGLADTQTFPIPFYTDFTQQDVAGKFTIVDLNPTEDGHGPYTWVIGTETYDPEAPDAEFAKDLLESRNPQWRDGVDPETLSLAAVYNGYRRSENVYPNMYRPHRPGDDYLITPALKSYKGAKYTLTFSAIANINQNFGSNMDIYVGSAPTVEAMKQGMKIASVEKIRDRNTLLDDEDPDGHIYTYEFTAPEDGELYIGFHSRAESDCIFWINYINVSAETLGSRPATIADLEAKAGEKGAYTVDLSFTVPDKDIDGKPIDTIDNLSIFRDDNLSPLMTFTNPTPGQVITYQDTFDGVENPSGNRKYSVSCSNDGGISEQSSVTVWVGEDICGPVKNLTLTEGESGYILSWERPDQAVNGYYVDFDNVRYEILGMVRFGSQSTNQTQLGSTNDLQFEVPYDYFYGFPGQYSVSFFVISFTSTGANYSKSTAVAHTIGGELYKAPYKESFAGGEPQTSPWSVNEVPENGLAYSPAWSYTTESADRFGLTASDNDQGYAVFSNDAYRLYSQRLVSPKLDLTGVRNPEIVFCTGWSGIMDKSEDNNIQVEIYDGNNYIPVGEPIVIGTETGWAEHTVSLANSQNLEKYRVSLNATGLRYNLFLVDNIRIKEGKPDSINLVGADSDAATAVATDGGVIIFGNTPYTVFTPNGITVARGTAAGSVRITLPTGLYIISFGDKSVKCAVK